MKADAKTQAAVLEVLNGVMENYQKRDMDGLMRLVAPDDDLFLFGTGIDEKRIGREQFKAQAERDWAQTDELSFHFNWGQISAAGPVAWAAGDGIGKGKAGGQEIEFPMRLTAVLTQQDGQWYLAQSHFSLPAAAQEEGDSVPV